MFADSSKNLSKSALSKFLFIIIKIFRRRLFNRNEVVHIEFIVFERHLFIVSSLQKSRVKRLNKRVQIECIRAFSIFLLSICIILDSFMSILFRAGLFVLFLVLFVCCFCVLKVVLLDMFVSV